MKGYDAAKNIVAGGAAVGTPILLISLLGKVSGLSASGITSGLAALGFGSMLMGLVMVVVVAGVVYWGVHKLFELCENDQHSFRW